VTDRLYVTIPADFSRQAQLDFLEWIHRGAAEIHNIDNIDNNDFGRIKELTA